MKVVLFDAKKFDEESFSRENGKFGFDLLYFGTRLNPETAVLAQGADVVVPFVNDQVDAETLRALKSVGVKLVAMRCAGYNNVDLQEAESLGIPVVRVPAYSPQAVAEHAVALLLALNRKIHRAYNRVRELNFSLDGLVGFDLHQKTVGVIGTGKIGSAFCKIMTGFGCRLLAYDPYPNPAMKGQVEYVPLKTLFQESVVISLHLPLAEDTHHLLDETAFEAMQDGALIINTSRGGLVDASALITALKSGRVGGAGLDVYEEEAGVFFEDWSNRVLQDDVLARLISFPNVLVTSHQAFLTNEALSAIAWTTLDSIAALQKGRDLERRVALDPAT